MKEELYSDIDLRFLAHPMTGNVRKLTNIDSIKQSIKNIVMTNQYEKIYDSNLYTNVSYSLFELVSDSDVIILRNKIEAVLNIYDRRVDLIDIKTRNNLEHNELFLDIIFRPQNSLENEVISIFLERVR